MLSKLRFIAKEEDHMKFPFLRTLMDNVNTKIDEELEFFRVNSNMNDREFASAKEDVKRLVAGGLNSKYTKMMTKAIIQSRRPQNRTIKSRRRVGAWNMHLRNVGMGKLTSANINSEDVEMRDVTEAVSAAESYRALSEAELLDLQQQADEINEERAAISHEVVTHNGFKADMNEVVEAADIMLELHDTHMIIIAASTKKDQINYSPRVYTNSIEASHCATLMESRMGERFGLFLKGYVNRIIGVNVSRTVGDPAVSVVSIITNRDKRNKNQIKKDLRKAAKESFLRETGRNFRKWQDVTDLATNWPEKKEEPEDVPDKDQLYHGDKFLIDKLSMAHMKILEKSLISGDLFKPKPSSIPQ